MPHFSRRKILIGISMSFNSSLLVSCNPQTGDSESAEPSTVDTDLSILSDVAFTIFPHDSLPQDLYDRVATEALAMDSVVISQGLAALKVDGNGSWLALTDSAKVELLQNMENSEFFALMRATTINVLYGDPDFFALIGYGGSAIEQGGYLNRGFDDIDWLPVQEASR